MSLNPFDVMKNILNRETKYTDEELIGYPQFMLNRIISQEYKLIFLASAISVPMSNRMHYDILYHAVPKMSTAKYIKWILPKKIDSDESRIGFIMDYFQVNKDNAIRYLELIDKEEKQKIFDYYEKCGTLNKGEIK